VPLVQWGSLESAFCSGSGSLCRPFHLLEDHLSRPHAHLVYSQFTLHGCLPVFPSWLAKGWGHSHDLPTTQSRSMDLTIFRGPGKHIPEVLLLFPGLASCLLMLGFAASGLRHNSQRHLPFFVLQLLLV
jgi:hypothetical protein